jgi:hypothetical protein
MIRDIPHLLLENHRPIVETNDDILDPVWYFTTLRERRPDTEERFNVY